MYYYTMLTQLDEWWVDKLDAGEITIKTAIHLSKLSAEQQDFLDDWPNITQNQILSIEATYSEKDVRRVLERTETSMKELRIHVSADILKKSKK